MIYIIAGHGDYPSKTLKTIEFLAGVHDNIYAVSEEVSNNDYQLTLQTLLQKHADQQVIIFTDVLEGAINQYCIRLLHQYQFKLIAGYNLAIILELLYVESASDETIENAISVGREQMAYVNDLVKAHD